MTYIHIAQENALSMFSISSCNDMMKNVKNDNNDIENNNNNNMKKQKIEMMTKIGLQWYNHMGQPNKNNMKQKMILNHDYNYEIYTLLQSWVSFGIINRNEYNQLVNDDINTIQQMKYDIIDILPWNTPYNNRINMKTILLNSRSNNNNRRNSTIIHNDDIVTSKNNVDGLENKYNDNQDMMKKTLLLEQQEQEEQTESSSSSDDDEDDYDDDPYSSFNRLSSLRSSLSLKDYNTRWRRSYRMDDTIDINISDLSKENNRDKYRQIFTNTTIKPTKKVRFLNIK